MNTGHTVYQYLTTGEAEYLSLAQSQARTQKRQKQTKKVSNFNFKITKQDAAFFLGAAFGLYILQIIAYL